MVRKEDEPMMWWDIIKNQISSTKGKTFSLDFSQPMVEEDDSCKQKLLDLFKRLESFSKEDYETQNGVDVNLFDKTVSEEQCCRAINFFKVIRDDKGGWSSNIQEHGMLGAWKNNYRDYLEADGDLGRYYVSAIAIGRHYIVSLKRNVSEDATNEEIEKIGREFKEVSDRLFVL